MVACQVPVSAPAVLEHPPQAFLTPGSLVCSRALICASAWSKWDMGQEVAVICPALLPLSVQAQLEPFFPRPSL